MFFEVNLKNLKLNIKKISNFQFLINIKNPEREKFLYNNILRHAFWKNINYLLYLLPHGSHRLKNQKNSKKLNSHSNGKPFTTNKAQDSSYKKEIVVWCLQEIFLLWNLPCSSLKITHWGKTLWMVTISLIYSMILKRYMPKKIYIVLFLPKASKNPFRRSTF